MRFRTTVHHQYVNQHFAKGVRRSWVARHPRWFSLCLCIVIAAALYGLYGHAYWQLKSLTIQGTYTLSTQELRDITIRQMQGRWLLVFRQDKLWSFDTKTYERRLRERWIFTDIKVTRSLPNTLQLTVMESKPVLQYSFGDHIYGIDEHGNTSTIMNERLKSIPTLIVSQEPTNVALQQNLISKEAVGFFQTWAATLGARSNPALVTTTLQIPPSPDTTARIHVAGDWDILVDLTQPVQIQIDAFLAAYDQKLQSRKLQYVDVTVPARVYYK